MGFALTPTLENPRQKKPTSPRKTASGDFFAKPNRTRPANRRQPLKTQVGKPTHAYKIASGRPFWLSRDPITERGGFNLYGFIGNDGVNYSDYLGMRTTSFTCDSFKDVEKMLWGSFACKPDVERFSKRLNVRTGMASQSRSYVAEIEIEYEVCKCDCGKRSGGSLSPIECGWETVNEERQFTPSTQAGGDFDGFGYTSYRAAYTRAVSECAKARP